MPRTQRSPDDLEGALPQFDHEEADETEDRAPPPPPGDETPPQTSPSRQSPPERPSKSTGTTPSSTGSSDTAPAVTLEDLTDAIGDAAGQLFESGAEWMNRREVRKKHRVTARWLATDDEVEAIGAVAERYLIEKVPDTVKDSEDATAAAVAGLVLAGYALRNLIGADGAAPRQREPDRAPGAAPEAPRPAPPPPPAPAPAVLHGDAGVAPSEAPPLAVISPDI